MTARVEPPAAQKTRLMATEKHPGDLTDAELALWRQFQAASPWLDSPFFSPGFTLAVGEARADTRVAVLSEDGTIRGFFPYHRAMRGIGRPVGGTLSDYQGPILAPDFRPSADDLLRACHLRAYDFNHCPADLAPLAAGGFIRARSPRISFARGYDAYISDSTPSRREAIRDTERRVRKMEREAGPMTYVFDDRRPACWDWLVETKTKALAKDGARAGFRIPWIDRLNAKLREPGAEGFAGVLSTVSCGDQLVAAHFGLRQGPVLCWWHTTFNDEFRQYAPGLVALLWTIREGPHNGLTVIDMGRGDQRYKLTFANGDRALCEGAIARTGSIASLLRLGHRLASSLSDALPPGAWQNLPRRAAGRLISNVRLPPIREADAS